MEKCLEKCLAKMDGKMFGKMYGKTNWKKWLKNINRKCMEQIQPNLLECKSKRFRLSTLFFHWNKYQIYRKMCRTNSGTKNLHSQCLGHF